MSATLLIIFFESRFRRPYRSEVRRFDGIAIVGIPGQSKNFGANWPRREWQEVRFGRRNARYLLALAS